MADPQAILDAITAGDYDDQLSGLFEALFARAAQIDVGFGWKLTIDDDEWTQETVTVAELTFAEKACGISYLELDPLRRIEHCSALIVAHLHKTQAMTIPEAFARAEKLAVTDLADIVSAYQIPSPPKDTGPTPPVS